jgi:hypothetical protein
MASRSYSVPDETRIRNTTYTPHFGTYLPDDKSAEVLLRRKWGHYSASSTPNYFARIKRGEFLPQQAYSRWDYELYIPPGAHGCYREAYSSGWDCFVDYDFYPNNAEPTSESEAHDLYDNLGVDPNMDALAQAAIANMQPDLDLLTTLAEAHKTVDMIGNARKSFLDLFRRAKRGKFETAKAASDAWLSWRYGWRILGYDIQNIAAAYNRPIRDMILTSRSGEGDTASSSNSVDYSSSWNPYRIVEETTDDFSIRVTANGLFPHKSVNSLASLPITAWELVPFSFVGDWFISVGDALSAWDVVSKATTVSCSVGTKFERKKHWWVEDREGVEGSSPGVVPGSGFSSGGGNSSYIVRQRVPTSLPTFIPQARLNLNSAKIADMAALLLKTKTAMKLLS